jgi:hypothetical protein
MKYVPKSVRNAVVSLRLPRLDASISFHAYLSAVLIVMMRGSWL